MSYYKRGRANSQVRSHRGLLADPLHLHYMASLSLTSEKRTFSQLDPEGPSRNPVGTPCLVPS